MAEKRIVRMVSPDNTEKKSANPVATPRPLAEKPKPKPKPQKK